MNIRSVILALALSLAVVARAVDEPKVSHESGHPLPLDPFAGATRDSVGLHEPDHLVPVNPYPGEWHINYSDQLRSRFKLDSFFFAQMVVRPSFSGEYVMRLHGTRDESLFDKTTEFFLTYSAADKSIWYSMPENNDTKKQLKVSIVAVTVEVPNPLAARIQQLWQRMLLRTRYPEKAGGGLDGVTYEFGMWYVYGETWSPRERKSPLLFIELGESLISYCKAAPAQRQAAATEIENKAAQLEKYLNEHQPK